MKLSKKKICFFVSVFILTTVLFFVLCSFTFPSFSTNPSDILTVNSLSSLDVGYLNAIIDKQSILGMFNSQELICLIYDGTNVRALFYPPTATLSGTVSVADNTVLFTLSLGNYFTQVYFTDSGFTMFQNNSRSISFSLSYVIYYRLGFSDAFSWNSNFVYSSDTLNPTILSVSTYWTDYFNRVISGDPSSLDSAYESGLSDGYESGYVDGFDTGYDYGYQFGYQDGYPDGIGTGYTQGYFAGEAAGYDTGYDDGYQDGYETGYDSGYSEAERETVIEYVEPIELDIPRIFNSIGAVPRQVLHGVDFEIFGVPILGVLLSILVLTISIFVIRKIK